MKPDIRTETEGLPRSDPRPLPVGAVRFAGPNLSRVPRVPKTTRDARTPMFTGLSRLSRVSRVKKKRAKQLPSVIKGRDGLKLLRDAFRFEL
jgi:hypothetical protein